VTHPTNDEQLSPVTLTGPQRVRANRLFESIVDNEMEAAFELIWLRDHAKELARLLKYAATYSSLAPHMNDAWRKDALSALRVTEDSK